MSREPSKSSDYFLRWQLHWQSIVWEPIHWLCLFDKHANDNVDSISLQLKFNVPKKCPKPKRKTEEAKTKLKPLTIILDDSHIDSHVDHHIDCGFSPYMLMI